MTLDAKALLDLSITGANDTRSTPIPIGEYTAIIEDVDAAAWQGKKDPSQSGIKLLCKLNIDDANVKAFLEREKVVITHDIMLDTTPAGGLDLGKGKNVRLGQLREAVGLNSPSDPFGFRMLVGKVLKVKIDHELYQGQPQAKVAGVAKI